MIPYAAVDRQDPEVAKGPRFHLLVTAWGEEIVRRSAQTGNSSKAGLCSKDDRSSWPSELPGGPSWSWHPSGTWRMGIHAGLSGMLAVPGPSNMLSSLPRTLPCFGKLLFIL